MILTNKSFVASVMQLMISATVHAGDITVEKINPAVEFNGKMLVTHDQDSVMMQIKAVDLDNSKLVIYGAGAYNCVLKSARFGQVKIEAVYDVISEELKNKTGSLFVSCDHMSSMPFAETSDADQLAQGVDPALTNGIQKKDLVDGKPFAFSLTSKGTSFGQIQIYKGYWQSDLTLVQTK